MKNPQHVDFILLGAGQANGPLAGALAKAGHRVALVERAYVGGTCVNYGCTPTKTLIRSASAAHTIRHSRKLGIDVSDFTVQMRDVRQRKRDIVQMFRSGAESGLESQDHVELVYGHGRFTDPHTIQVQLNDGGTRLLRGDRIVIDTGQRQRIPDLPGLDQTPYLDSTSIMELDTLPRRLIVLGGGYVGVEFAQLFARLGSEVLIVTDRAQLLPHEDADIAEALAGVLEQDGVALRFNAPARRTDASGDGIALEYGQDGASSVVHGSHLLVATGRQPNTDDIGLEHAGLDTDDRGMIAVDSQLRTAADHIFAAGDIVGHPAFTHTAYDDYRVLKDLFVGEGKRSTASRILTYVLFTEPQLGRVGLTESQAKQQGLDYAVGTMPAHKIGRAVETGHDQGLLKVLVDRQRHTVLGGALLCHEAGEMIATLQTAMMAGLPYTRLQHAVLAHPTMCEGFRAITECCG